jgi:DNA-binding protein YbaB
MFTIYGGYMELQEIEVTIGKDGQVQIQVRGVQGMKCLEITKELEDALGGEILTRIMTPEALEQEIKPTDADQDQHLRASG